MSIGLNAKPGERVRRKLVCGPSRTKQAPAESCDINKMIERFQRTGLIQVSQKQGVYADVSEVADYQVAMNVVARANELFSSIPAKVRERFGNDPQRFIEFMQDEENIPEAIKLGLAVERKPEPEKIQKVQVVDAPEKGPEPSK